MKRRAAQSGSSDRELRSRSNAVAKPSTRRIAQNSSKSAESAKQMMKNVDYSLIHSTKSIKAKDAKKLNVNSSSSSSSLRIEPLGPPIVDDQTLKRVGRPKKDVLKEATVKSVGASSDSSLSDSRWHTSTPSKESLFRFNSCLSNDNIENDTPTDTPSGDTSPKGLRPVLLRRALSIRELEDDSWLSSSLIDLVISKFSKTYKGVHFMSIDFVVLALSSLDRHDLEQATDISGKSLDYTDTSKKTPIVFICNSNNIHWNCIRIIRGPVPQLQLFEPMGKPKNRHGGLGYRDVPRCVIQWLDTCSPLNNGKSWISVGMSVITNQQQYTPFDCGVACLLYAEKCGQGHSPTEINEQTTQGDITEYRKLIQDFVHAVNEIESSQDMEWGE